MSEKMIAFFDSGIGGLNTMANFHVRYPFVQCLYCGDNEHAPYGDKTDDEIFELARKAFQEIARYPVSAAVIACNTVTAKCIDALRKLNPFPIIGTEPAILPAVRSVQRGKILLVATQATLQSERFRRLKDKNKTDCEIVLYCPHTLAGDIENVAPDFSRLKAEEYFPKGRFDAVVLGCTHYIYVESMVQKLYNCPVFDGIAGTVDHLAQVVNICSQNTKKQIKIPPIYIGTKNQHNKCIFETLI